MKKSVQLFLSLFAVLLLSSCSDSVDEFNDDVALRIRDDTGLRSIHDLVGYASNYDQQAASYEEQVAAAYLRQTREAIVAAARDFSSRADQATAQSQQTITAGRGLIQAGNSEVASAQQTVNLGRVGAARCDTKSVAKKNKAKCRRDASSLVSSGQSALNVAAQKVNQGNAQVAEGQRLSAAADGLRRLAGRLNDVLAEKERQDEAALRTEYQSKTSTDVQNELNSMNAQITQQTRDSQARAAEGNALIQQGNADNSRGQQLIQQGRTAAQRCETRQVARRQKPKCRTDAQAFGNSGRILVNGAASKIAQGNARITEGQNLLLQADGLRFKLDLLQKLAEERKLFESQPKLASDDEIDALVRAYVEDISDLSESSVVYKYKQILETGEVMPAALSDASIPITGPSVLYFIDEVPGAYFGHSSHIILANKQTKDILRIQGEWYPAFKVGERVTALSWSDFDVFSGTPPLFEVDLKSSDLQNKLPADETIGGDDYVEDCQPVHKHVIFVKLKPSTDPASKESEEAIEKRANPDKPSGNTYTLRAEDNFKSFDELKQRIQNLFNILVESGLCKCPESSILLIISSHGWDGEFVYNPSSPENWNGPTRINIADFLNNFVTNLPKDKCVGILAVSSCFSAVTCNELDKTSNNWNFIGGSGGTVQWSHIPSLFVDKDCLELLPNVQAYLDCVATKYKTGLARFKGSPYPGIALVSPVGYYPASSNADILLSCNDQDDGGLRTLTKGSISVLYEDFASQQQRPNRADEFCSQDRALETEARVDSLLAQMTDRSVFQSSNLLRPLSRPAGPYLWEFWCDPNKKTGYVDIVECNCQGGKCIPGEYEQPPSPEWLCDDLEDSGLNFKMSGRIIAELSNHQASGAAHEVCAHTNDPVKASEIKALLSGSFNGETVNRVNTLLQELNVDGFGDASSYLWELYCDSSKKSAHLVVQECECFNQYSAGNPPNWGGRCRRFNANTNQGYPPGAYE